MLHILSNVIIDFIASFIQFYANMMIAYSYLTLTYGVLLIKISKLRYSYKVYDTSLMLHNLREQSSPPLANFLGSTREKSMDQALFVCSLCCSNPCPLLVSHIYSDSHIEDKE